MPIDIDTLRAHKGGDPSVCVKSECRRGNGDGESLVNSIIAADEIWRTGRQTIDNLRKQRAAITKSIRDKVRANLSPDAEKEASKQLAKRVAAEEEKGKQECETRDALLHRLGNILDTRVTEADRVLREWKPNKTALPVGKALSKDSKFVPRAHGKLAEMLKGGIDAIRGASVAGRRGYFLKGELVRLKMALERYAMDFLCSRSPAFVPVYTPFFMEPSMLQQAVQLNDFGEMIYSTGDKHLVATSEQPLSAMHQSEWIQEKSLPILYAGTSTCFRREAGRASTDLNGLFRVHQFEKVEQFALCEPNDSDRIHQEFLGHAEAFLQSLGISYRVVSVAGKDLNMATSLKYDVEAWFPASKAYREVVSCSNCTDFLSRALDIRCGSKKMIHGGKKQYVHMVNSTLCAVQRMICAILENYQTEGGVCIPQVLIPYISLNGKDDFMPFGDACARELDCQHATKAMKAAARKKAAFLKQRSGHVVAANGNVAVKVKAKDNRDSSHSISSKKTTKRKVPVVKKRLKLFSDEGMTWLDERLSDQSYLLGPNGYVASAEDCVVYNALKAAGRSLSDHQNTSRWFRNLSAASRTERESWPASREHVLSGSVSFLFDLSPA
eukprot:g6304.t1